MMTRDYLSVKVWDLNMENRPVETYQVQKHTIVVSELIGECVAVKLIRREGTTWHVSLKHFDF